VKPQKFSTLDMWNRLWDRKLSRGLHGNDFKRLHMLGFNEDKISFQLIRPHRRSHISDWANDNSFLRKLIIRSFPNITNAAVRNRAGRWLRVIKMFWVQQMSRGEISLELGQNYNTVSCLIKAIRKAVERSRIPVKRGRPQKGGSIAHHL
jgi:hypothetical protein